MILETIKERGIFEELKDIPALPISRSTRKYRSNPTYRRTNIERAKTWNQENPDRKRANDQRWARKGGAAASRRYRQRQKEKLHGNT